MEYDPVDQPVFVNHLGLLHLIQLCKVRGTELLCEFLWDGPGPSSRRGTSSVMRRALLDSVSNQAFEDLEKIHWVQR